MTIDASESGKAASTRDEDEDEDNNADYEMDAFGGQDKPLIKQHKDSQVVRQLKLAPSYKLHFYAVGTLLFVAFGLVTLFWPYISHSTAFACGSVNDGYNCHLPVSHLWGQYSPYFSVESDIEDSLPDQCKITFAQALSRHGARFPTSHKSEAYRATIQQLQHNVQIFSEKYSFLENYMYDLGADDQTTFGQQEMVDSGAKFYERYRFLARSHPPFFRASSSSRVVESAQNFTQGFHSAKRDDNASWTLKSDLSPYEILLISEAAGSNNTLDHGVCTAFEDGEFDDIPLSARNRWIANFVPPIQKRLNSDLPGANLSSIQTIYLMDLCPFGTVATEEAKQLSPFCHIFTMLEWEQYNYLQSLDKYYSYGSGNPLGPSQGVGFVNELIARMTNQLVTDETSTNHTLDNDPATFPVGDGHVLYADFSHDTQMVSILSALGVYNTTVALPDSRIATSEESHGYSAAWAVSFAARIYVEKMMCTDRGEEELVRILVNDRVIVLPNCGADDMGRCSLMRWVDSLSFARHDGHWDECFKRDLV